uniref:Uncharacterized protein n=1 Tax=Nelumbo nucifera TaxID=4432 RepID=A0A822Y3L2_NELNU|nr:TPA_asm: hypothetical protein HUJ06_027284 [Nelumbo nucifera]
MTGLNQFLRVAMIALVVLAVYSPASTSARFLNGLRPHNLAATQPALNLVLPGGHIDASSSSSSKSGSLRLFPCESETVESTENLRRLEFPPSQNQRKSIAGKHGQLVLNILPKGRLPPSGPSKRTNKLVN